MSRHLAIELLSSYVDDEVTPRQLRLVESHLDDCTECRQRLEGLRSVAASVRRLESVAPPSTLGATLERRIRIAAREEAGRTSLEKGLGRWLGQPVLAPVFAVVLALGAILYLFSYGLSMRGDPPTRVVVASLPDDAPTEELAEEPAGEMAARREMVALGATLEQEVTAAPPSAGTEAPARGGAPATNGGASDPAAADLLSKEAPDGRGPAGSREETEASTPAQVESQRETMAAALRRVRDDNDETLQEPARNRAAPAAKEPVVTSPADVDEVVVASGSAHLADGRASAEGRSRTRLLEGRTFVWTDEGVWVEFGVSGEPVAETIDLGEEGAPSDSELAPFSELGRVRLRLDSRVVEVVFPLPRP